MTQPTERPTLVVVASLLAAQFLTTLDTSIVYVALPSMQADLRVPDAHLQWIATAYLVALGGSLLVCGRIADYRDPRAILQLGLLLFGAASLLGGGATVPWVLVAARALQGLAAAMITPTALALITIAVQHDSARRRLLSWWSAVGSVGFSSGALLGGVLVQWLSWRAVLLVNVPLVLLALAGVRRLPQFPRGSESRSWRHLDMPGTLLIITGSGSLVFAVSQVPDAGWVSVPVLGGAAMVGAAALALALVEKTISSPLVPLRILKSKPLLAANGISLVFGVTATSGLFFLVTLFLQHQLRIEPLLTGLAFLPMALIATAVAPVVGRLSDRWSPRLMLVAGLVLIALGLAHLSRLKPDSNYPLDLLPGMLIVGIGFVPVLVTTVEIATHSVEIKDRGLASGLVNTTSQIGGALGIAIYLTTARSSSANTQVGQGMTLQYGQAFSLGAALAVVTCFLVATFYPTSGRAQRSR